MLQFDKHYLLHFPRNKNRREGAAILGDHEGQLMEVPQLIHQLG